jgi:hypothetical protein
VADQNDDQDKVGYGKPPKHSQFQPGQSGNPRGRPKGARGVKTDLSAELSATWITNINGKPIKGTKQRLMFRTLTARAATGDVKAAAILLPLILQVLGMEDRGGERQRLSPQDDALLNLLLAEQAASPPEAEPEPYAKSPGSGAQGEQYPSAASDDAPTPEGAGEDG